MAGLVTQEDLDRELEQFKLPKAQVSTVDNPFAADAPQETPRDPYGPPAPSPTESWLSSYVADLEEQDDQATAIAYDAARVQNPTLYRKAQEAARLGDLPADVVYRNIETFEQRDRLKTVREVLRRNSGLNEWFRHADNARTVTVENLEDADNLSWVLQATPKAIGQGVSQLSVSDIRFRQVFGEATPEEIARADDIESTLTDDYGGTSWVGRGFVGALSNLPIMGSIIAEGIEGAAYGAVAGGAVGSAVPGIGTAAGGVSGATIGAGVWAYRESFRLNTAEAYSDFLRIRTSDGRKLDPSVMSGAAVLSGALSAGLDVAGLGVLLKATGIGNLVAKYGAKGAIKEALKDQSFRTVMATLGKRFAGAAAAEGITEALQEGIKEVTGETIRTAAETTMPDTEYFVKRAGEIGTDMAVAARDAFMATLFLGAIPMGGRLVHDLSAARNVEPDQEKFNRLLETASKDKLVAEDPAKASELVASSLQGTDRDTVYLDVESVREFMQAEDSPEVAALAKLPGFQKALSEAVQSGSDVAIPTADFYAYVAPTDAAASLIERLKFSPEGMSKKQAESFVKALEAMKEEKLNEIVEPSKTTVSRDVYDKTRRAGATPDQARQYAALYGAFFDSMASKTGRNSWDIYRSYAVELQQVDANPDTGDIGSFSQGGDNSTKLLAALGEGASSADLTAAPSTQDGPLTSAEVRLAGSKAGGTLTYDAAKDRLYFSAVSAQGHGKALYDAVEKQFGVKLQPQLEYLSNDAYSFWKKRDPESVKDYVKVEDGEGGHWEHPDPARFEQGTGKVLRGSITFRPDKTLIRLFNGANLSTLLHESGHLFLQVMSDLVEGKRAYGGELFQADDVTPGAWIILQGQDGKASIPLKVSAVVEGPGGKRQVTVEGAKGIYDIDTAIIVSDPNAPAAEALEAPSTDESEKPSPPMGDSPVVDPAAQGLSSSPVEQSPGGTTYYSAKFDVIAASNRGFKRFVEGKSQATEEEKRDLLFTYFPKSKEALAFKQSAAARAQNAAAPAPKRKGRPGKKANPLGLNTEASAVMDVDQTVDYVGDVVRATAKLTAAISNRQSDKIMRSLRIGLRTMRKGAGEGSVNSDAWAELEAQLQQIQPGGVFPDKVREVVDEYIALYKNDEALRSEKAAAQEERAARKGERQAVKDAAAASAKDVADAISELSTVVERIERVEAQKQASEELVQDMKTLRAWLGEDGPVFSTEAHEKFARAFEAYLFDGVPPNEGLRRAFERFKTWLKMVYRKVANLGAQPTAEVRGVFDRMLTIDQTISNQTSNVAFQPAFSSAEEMGVTQEEYEAYLANVDTLAEVGRQAAEKAAMVEVAKTRTKAVYDKKAELRKEYRADFMTQRVYRVMNYLQGNRLQGVQGVAAAKLDRAKVEAILGKGKLGDIPNGNQLWTKTGGIDPNSVAVLFGYASGAEMLAEIAATPPLKVAVDKKVDAAIAQMTDEELVTPAQVQEMTAAKLRSDVYNEFLRTEIRAYSKLMGIDFTDAHVAHFKRLADDIIGDKSVRRVMRRNFLNEYLEADRNVGRALEKALREKDLPAALDLRRKQLFNSFLTRRAYEVKADVEKAVKYLRGFNKKKSRVIDQSYLSQIRNVAIRLGFIKGQVDSTVPELSRFISEELAAGSMIIVDPRFKRPDARPFVHLTSDELLTVRDSVKNLEFMGRNKRNLIRGGVIMDVKVAVAEIAAAMDANLRAPREASTLNPRGMPRFFDALNTYNAIHTKIEQLCDWIDGRAPQGPAHRYIFQPMADAQTAEVEMADRFAKKVLEAIQKKPVSYWAEEFLVPEINRRVKRSEALAVALNMGNESNLKKLKKGMGWTDAQLAAVTKRLDKSDWETAQQIWDTIEGLWPHVLDVAQRTGIPRPDKVEAVQFTNEHGTFRGGYYPVVYDPRKSAEALARGMDAASEGQFGFEPHSVFPPKSFASDRNDAYAQPILLDMTVLPSHIARVVHYITHAEAVYSVQKVLASDDIKARLIGQFGPAMVANVKGWMDNITHGEMEISGLSAPNRFLRALRQNVSLAALGFRAMTVVSQAGGVFSGAEMIGITNVAHGLKEMYGSASLDGIRTKFDFIRSRSGEMRHRMEFLDRDIAEVTAAFEQRSRLQKVQSLAMKPMLIADNVVSSAIWMGAYSAQLRRDIHDEKTAIAYADKVVRLTQGAAGAKDFSAVQRGNEFLKLFTMFYTYFAAMQNRVMDIARTVRYRAADAPNLQRTDTPHEALRVLYLIVLPSLIFDTLMKGAAQGDFSEDSDKDVGTLVSSALWRIFGYSFAGAIGIRDLVDFVGKEGFEWRYGAAPVLRSVEMTIERANRVGTAAVDENKDVKPSDALRLGVDVIGMTTGAPVDAPTLFLQNYLKAQEKGEEVGLIDFVVRR